MFYLYYVTFTIPKNAFKSSKNKYRVLGGKSWKEAGSLNQRLLMTTQEDCLDFRTSDLQNYKRKKIMF